MMPEAFWHKLKRIREDIRQTYPESIPPKPRLRAFLPDYYVVKVCYDEAHPLGLHAHPDGKRAIREEGVVSQNG